MFVMLWVHTSHVALWAPGPSPLDAPCRFPSLILPGFLYLGDWGDAEQQERLQELKVKR